MKETRWSGFSDFKAAVLLPPNTDQHRNTLCAASKHTTY